MPMRLRLFVALIGLALTAPALRAQNIEGFASLTIDNTAGGVRIPTTILTVQGQQMSYCEGRLETAQVRFTDDGTAPTTTVGTIIEIGEFFRGYGNEFLRRARFIRTGAVSGTMQFRCYPKPPEAAR